jgi:putative hydrolase of the HAD superfamily
MSRNIREPFHKVDTWVFDLDNTLYSEECDLFAQIDVRMGEFLTSHLKVDLVEARRVQKQYYHEYGTTLAGLMLNDDVDPADFLHHVHDIDVSVIPPSPELSGFFGPSAGPQVHLHQWQRPACGQCHDTFGRGASF